MVSTSVCTSVIDLLTASLIGAAQPTETGPVGGVDDLQQRRVEQMRLLLTTGHIQVGAAQNPVHGPEGYNNLHGSDFKQSAGPEQEERDKDEDEDDHGVPPTQAGGSRDPPPKEESKKLSRKGDPSRPHKCPEPGCPKETEGFKRPDHLVRHMFDHYDPPYICERSGCDTKARRKDKIKDHLMRNHDLDNEQAKTEANALALAALSRLTRITTNIKQRLAAQPASAGNQVADPEEEEAGRFDEAGHEPYDSEDAGEDNTQNTLDGEASPEDPTRRLHAHRLIERYDDVSSDDESSDDGEDSNDEASGRPLKGKRPRDDSDDDRVGQKRVNMG